MEIISKRSGRWADSEGPHKKQIVMTKGETYTDKHIPAHMIEYFVGRGFAESVGKTSFTVRYDYDKLLRAKLKGIVDKAGGKRKAKIALEKWGKENLNGYDLDRSKNVDDCINILIAAHAEMIND